MNSTTTYYKQEVISCPVCGEHSTMPITYAWLWEHCSYWHDLKWWIKRKFQKGSSK